MLSPNSNSDGRQSKLPIDLKRTIMNYTSAMKQSTNMSMSRNKSFHHSGWWTELLPAKAGEVHKAGTGPNRPFKLLVSST